MTGVCVYLWSDVEGPVAFVDNMYLPALLDQSGLLEVHATFAIKYPVNGH